VLRRGDILENPITGERLVFAATSAETGGECTVFDAYVRANGSVAAPHVHPYQTELFEIRTGRIGVKLGRETIAAGPGDVLTVAPGVAHQFWNAGDSELAFRATVTPSLEFESLIETMFALAVDGKTNKKGMPNPLRLAVIAQAHFDVVRLPRIPHALQRIALAAGAPVGKALGYGPTYVPAPADAVAAGVAM
jgi:mannose-6-phosphate isomerase-like protein (cupin superfamily)